MTPAEKIQLGYLLAAAIGLIFGMVIMAVARVERGDLDEDNDNFEFWIDD